MSVDLITYKVQPLTDDELNKIRGTNAYDLSEIDGWGIKEYSLDDVTNNPARFNHIKSLMKTVELMHTQTDYKACFIANGLPEDVRTYSSQHNNWGCVVHFDDKRINVTREELDKFTTTTPREYCVIKRKHIDADVDGWVARSLMDKLDLAFGADDDSDLSYTPIHLNSDVCKLLCKTLVDLYDADDIYPSENLARFMLEIMRAMQSNEGDVFIEFQD